MPEYDKAIKVMEQQRYLKEVADISYQCSFEKIDEVQFFQKYLWDFLGIKWEDLLKEIGKPNR